MCSDSLVRLEWVPYMHLVDGSNPSRSTNSLKSHYSSMVEQLSCKQQVSSSSLDGGSIKLIRRKTMSKPCERKKSPIINKPDISNYLYVTAVCRTHKRTPRINKLIFLCRNLDEANHVYNQISRLPMMKYVMICETQPNYFVPGKYFAGITQYISMHYSVQVIDHNTLSWSGIYRQ